MTIELNFKTPMGNEFVKINDSIRFNIGDRVMHNGQRYEVWNIDFETADVYPKSDAMGSLIQYVYLK